MLSSPPGWNALQRRAQQTDDPHELSKIIDEMNRLLSRHEKSSKREWQYSRLFERSTSKHNCIFYGSEDALVEFLVPYFAEGLRKGEYCFGAQPSRVRTRLLRRLQSSRLGIRSAVLRKALKINCLEDTYFSDGRFEPLAMMDTLKGALGVAQSGKFSGLRVAGDVSWAMRERKLFGQALYYEKLLDLYMPGKKMTTVCHYEASLCTPMDMGCLAQVHQRQLRLAI
jgi:hypothetical protein